MTPSAAESDFGGRRYHRFVPFNFLLSLATPHLHGALFLSPVINDNDTGKKCIIGVVVTGDHFSVFVTPVINLSPKSKTPPIKEIRDKD